MTADTGTPVMTRAEREDLFIAALEHFTLVLIWLDRGRPRSLCIDGHEYRRRQKSRRRRKRR